MPIGVRDMGFNTATNLFLMIGMTYPQPENPKTGDMFLDPVNNMWRVFNGITWVDVSLKEHKCNLDDKSIQE
jgi:G:T/U-mismatch repair DNA glycosylase|tara:strand:+ start:281 stop:496 length:216 start_codon:yes stop_codon:yes gene_type:complete